MGVLSVLASGVNITGIIPQLRTMLAARSSRGQSPLGWTPAATCSGSLLFVNAVGYHAFVLAGGDFMSLSGCLSAVLLARHFRDRDARLCSDSSWRARLERVVIGSARRGSRRPGGAGP